MYRLTEARKLKATPILESHRDQLKNSGWVNLGKFERELRDAWSVGYQELKGLIEDLSKLDEYQDLAMYYMLYSNSGADGPMPVAEFQDPIAKLLEIPNWMFEPNRNGAIERYWASRCPLVLETQKRRQNPT